MASDYIEKLGIFVANGLISMGFVIITIIIYHFKELKVLVPIWLLCWLLVYQVNFWEIKNE